MLSLTFARLRAVPSGLEWTQSRRGMVSLRRRTDIFDSDRHPHILTTLDPTKLTRQDHIRLSGRSSVDLTYAKPRKSSLRTGRDPKYVGILQKRALPPNSSGGFLYAHTHSHRTTALLSAVVKPKFQLFSDAEETLNSQIDGPGRQSIYTLSFSHTLPLSTSGFFYLRRPPAGAPATACSLRFRVTRISDPSSFADGEDLRSAVTSLPWELPLASPDPECRNLLKHRLFRYVLSKDAAVPTEVLQRCFDLAATINADSDGGHTDADRRQDLNEGPTPLIYAFGQPFFLDFAQTTQKLHILNDTPDAVHTLYVDLPTVEESSWRKAHALYKGCAVACFEPAPSTPTPTSTSTPAPTKAVIRILQVLTPIVPDTANSYFGLLPVVTRGTLLPASRTVVYKNRGSVSRVPELGVWEALLGTGALSALKRVAEYEDNLRREQPAITVRNGRVERSDLKPGTQDRGAYTLVPALRRTPRPH